MNRDNAKDYLPLVQALAEGKVIQLQYGNGTWHKVEDPSFDLPVDQYRIKPEPREIWVAIDRDNDGSYMAYLKEDNAKRSGYPVVRYREVLE